MMIIEDANDITSMRDFPMARKELQHNCVINYLIGIRKLTPIVLINKTKVGIQAITINI